MNSEGCTIVFPARKFLLISSDTFVQPQCAVKNELPKLLLSVEYCFQWVENTSGTLHHRWHSVNRKYFRCLQTT